jgi:type III restriction enzyme
MATGSGKTKVMSLLLAWSYFHKLYEEDSELSKNFLLITPNIIVLDRIKSDFEGLKIFYEDPILPDNGYGGQNWQDDFQRYDCWNVDWIGYGWMCVVGYVWHDC